MELKRRNKRKMLSCLFLILAMCFCMSTSVSAKTVAKIGKKSYSSLQSAVNAVKKGQTIKLQRDVNMKKKSLTLTKNVSYTINLNKKKISNCSGIEVRKGKVTIKNGTYVAKKSGAFGYGYLNVYKGAKATLSNMTYTGFFSVKKGGTLVINSGTYNKAYLYNYGTAKIKNGTFKSAGYFYNGKNMTISNGSFQFVGGWDSSFCFENDGDDGKGVLTINGGTFSFPAAADEKFYNTGTMVVKRSVYNYIRRNINNHGKVKIS